MGRASLPALVTLLAVAALPQRAAAIPIIYGSGKTIAFVADRPALLAEGSSGKGDVDPKLPRIGYKYWHFHIFWIPLWTSTSEGEFVAYKEYDLFGTPCEPLGTIPRDISRRTGVPESLLKVPWSARHPWGLYVLIALIILWVVAAWLLSRSERKLTGRGAVPPVPPPPPRVEVLRLGTDGRGGVWKRTRFPWED
jgi:hypothetical protein